ncbi:MAG: hypothetical protein KAS16_08330 [Thermoplasmata archaeon]|nr:hypothetical protein [Thermoplasmata archaeon]
MSNRKLQPEIAMYMRRIGDMRENRKHGRAVQLCDMALEHEPDQALRNVILNFRADSLFRIGRRIESTELIDEARREFAGVLESDSDDYLAQRGLEEINFYQY